MENLDKTMKHHRQWALWSCTCPTPVEGALGAEGLDFPTTSTAVNGNQPLTKPATDAGTATPGRLPELGMLLDCPDKLGNGAHPAKILSVRSRRQATSEVRPSVGTDQHHWGELSANPRTEPLPPYPSRVPFRLPKSVRITSTGPADYDNLK